jgi:glutamate--cysteine ligase catalytic subunit
MATAHHRDAVLADKFWFRKNLFHGHPFPAPRSSSGGGDSPHSSPSSTRPVSPVPVEEEYTLMTINEIMNGIPGEFVGLVPLIESYLNTVNVDIVTRCKLSGYLSLVSKRASGELQTGATWIREFVRSHPDYKRDSVVGERINYDLMKIVEKLGCEGRVNGVTEKLLNA